MAHTSVTLGGQILGQPGLIHRRLDAGEARRGGEVRDSSSGDQMAGGGHLRDAHARPHLVVTVFGPGCWGTLPKTNFFPTFHQDQSMELTSAN